MANPVRKIVATRLSWFRSKTSKAAFVVSGDRWLAVSVVLVAVAFVDARGSWPPQVSVGLVVVGLVGAVVFVLRDLAEYFGRTDNWDFAAAPLDTTVLITCEELPTTLRTSLGRLVLSSEVNRNLSGAQTRVELARAGYRLEGDLRRLAGSLLRETSGDTPFNGPCLRLDSDLTQANTSQPGVLLRVRPARYFDSMCSNMLTKWRITRDDDLWRFHDLYLLQPPDGTSTRKLLSLGASSLANAIGTSTMAITTDDHLVVNLQSRISQSSSGRWAPSGSGSLEPRDHQDGDTLQSLAIRGALRELREECVLEPGQVAGSAVVGFGRWLDHGAKPELVTVTALTIDASQVVRRPRWGLTETTWTQRVKAVRLPLDDLTSMADPWASDVLVTRDLLDDSDLRAASSFPLEFGLRYLAEALQQDPDLLTTLRGQTP